MELRSGNFQLTDAMSDYELARNIAERMKVHPESICLSREGDRVDVAQRDMFKELSENSLAAGIPVGSLLLVAADRRNNAIIQVLDTKQQCVPFLVFRMPINYEKGSPRKTAAWWGGSGKDALIRITRDHVEKMISKQGLTGLERAAKPFPDHLKRLSDCAVLPPYSGTMPLFPQSISVYWKIE